MEPSEDSLAELSNPDKPAIIREVYDNIYFRDKFVTELENALAANKAVIIIEPRELGEETAHWIATGNCLQKTAVLSGLGAIISGTIWHDQPFLYCPLLSLSLFCTGLYTASWQFDPCVKYQVERDCKRLAQILMPSRMASHEASCGEYQVEHDCKPLPQSPMPSTKVSQSPVVLVRKDDTRRKVLRCSTISILAAAICVFRIYQSTT